MAQRERERRTCCEWHWTARLCLAGQDQAHLWTQPCCFPLRSSRSRLIVSPHVLSGCFLLLTLPFLATLPVVLTRWLQASKITRRPRHRHEAGLQHARKTQTRERERTHTAPTLGLLPTTARLPRRPSFKLPRGDYLATCAPSCKKRNCTFFSFAIIRSLPSRF